MPSGPPIGYGQKVRLSAIRPSLDGKDRLHLKQQPPKFHANITSSLVHPIEFQAYSSR